MTDSQETIDLLMEKVSWLKSATRYLRDMAEVEYAMTQENADVLGVLSRVVGVPDPDATLQCVDVLLDVTAEYVNDAAALVEAMEA